MPPCIMMRRKESSFVIFVFSYRLLQQVIVGGWCNSFKPASKRVALGEPSAARILSATSPAVFGRVIFAARANSLTDVTGSIRICQIALNHTDNGRGEFAIMVPARRPL